MKYKRAVSKLNIHLYGARVNPERESNLSGGLTPTDWSSCNHSLSSHSWRQTGHFAPDWELCCTHTRQICEYKENEVTIRFNIHLNKNVLILQVISIYKYILCMSVCLLPINVKTAKPIGPTSFVGPHMTPGKVYGCSKLEKFVSNKFRFSSNFENPRKNMIKSP